MDQRTMPITQEAALRVALACRAMPNVTLPRLIALLQSHLGEQIACENLRAITVTNLKTGLGSMDGEEDDEDMGIGIDAMKLAVRILWGEVQDDENLPQAEPYADGDIPDSLRIAIASDSGSDLNGHFGSCLRYLVYQVSATESRLIGVRSALEADFAEDKNLFRCQLIGDCHVLYVVSIGGPAAAKVIRADIFPIKLPNGGPAPEIIGRFQQALSDTPPPWLAKILGVSAEKRLRLYSAENEDD